MSELSSTSGRTRARDLAREHEIVAERARKLAELERRKSRLFASLSHEFRTPLTLTLGPLRDLEAGTHGPLPPRIAPRIALARDNAERMLALVEELLDLARSDSGRLEIRARPLDLARFLRRQSERFAGLAERRGIDLRYVPEVEALEIWADPDQLYKVVANLLSNAMRHSPSGVAVELRLEEPAPDGTVAVTVRDEGEGIPEDERELIFDRFYRVERSLESPGGGTGLGLPLAREIAELHGGSLTVASEVGVGSIFRLVLRLGCEHFAPSQLSAAAAGQRRPLPRGPFPEDDPRPAPLPLDSLLDERTTVLVVDDNPALRSYLRDHLGEAYRVLEAADGIAGLRLVREALPDLLVTDLAMPRMDGLELTRRIRNDPELPCLPVVMLTAKGSRESKLAGLVEGVDDYLVKPFDAAELLARIDNLLRLHRRLRRRSAGARGASSLVPVTPAAYLSDEDRAFLERLRGAVDEGISDEEFSVERLARRLAMDRTHLFRRLKRITGWTPSRLILETRLCRAAELIAGGEGRVGEIAAAVGFKSVSHFSERFRRQFGTTPSSCLLQRADDRESA